SPARSRTPRISTSSTPTTPTPRTAPSCGRRRTTAAASAPPSRGGAWPPRSSTRRRAARPGWLCSRACSRPPQKDRDMIIVPAIDIREGKCVRLVRGDPNKQTVYSDDPAEIAKRWAEQGATRIHVVDLDAAMGKGNNLEALKRIKESVNIMIQFGG